MRPPIFCLFLLASTIGILTGCAHQPYSDAYEPAGFFSGIWHGLVSPLTFVGSIFSDIRIYEFPNSGVWYDFGFMIGLFVTAIFLTVFFLEYNDHLK